MDEKENTRYCLKAAEVTFVGTDEGGVLYRHADSEYLGLNKTGSYIVSVLEQPQTMDAIAAAIEERFRVDKDRAVADTRAFLDSMMKAGVVALCE